MPSDPRNQVSRGSNPPIAPFRLILAVPLSDRPDNQPRPERGIHKPEESGEPDDKDLGHDRPCASQKQRLRSWWERGSIWRRVVIGCFTFLGTLASISGGSALAVGWSGNSGPSESTKVAEYQKNIGAICSDLNLEASALIQNADDLARRLKTANTLTSEKTAVLDSWNAELDDSDHELSIFEAQNAPNAEMAGWQNRTAAAWEDMDSRIGVYVQRVDAAATSAAFQSAVETGPALRKQLDADKIKRAKGLNVLGGGSCVLSPPTIPPALLLPESASPRTQPRTPIAPGGRPPASSQHDSGGRASAAANEDSTARKSGTAAHDSTGRSSTPSVQSQPEAVPPSVSGSVSAPAQREAGSTTPHTNKGSFNPTSASGSDNPPAQRKAGTARHRRKNSSSASPSVSPPWLPGYRGFRIRREL